VHPHPKRRSSDKPVPAKPKHENPIWETVSKMASEKLVERTHRANQALETLTKSLQETVVKHPPPIPKPAPAPVPAPAPMAKAPEPEPATSAPPKFDANRILKGTEEPEPEKPELGHLGEPEIPEDHVHPEDQSQSPHHNIQSVISKHSEVKPGEVIHFD
jgi:hypothetical protein